MVSHMRCVRVSIFAATLVGRIMLTAQDNKPPQKLLFQSKRGDVIFAHAAHVAREKGECAACHPKLWPQSAKEPLKSSDGCRTCHHAGGPAFESKGNCVKCHPDANAKTP
jgi:c(7)-type cytochrome triheme protein